MKQNFDTSDNTESLDTTVIIERENQNDLIILESINAYLSFYEKL